MNEPKISVIIPIYNAEKYLNECIDSIVGQTLKEIEIICIVDGATDSSYEIVHEYELKYDNVKVIKQQNSGVSVARNNGIEIAKAPYIMFVDSDDRLALNACETAYNEMIACDCDAVLYSCCVEYDGKSFPKYAFGEKKRYFDENEVFEILYRRCFGLTNKEMDIIEQQDYISPIWLKLYKASMIKDNNLRFVDINEVGSYEDGFFNLKYFELVKSAVYIPDTLYCYRRDNETSNTSVFKERLEQQWDKLFKYMENEIKVNNLPDVFSEALNNRRALSAIGLGINISQCKCSFFKKVKMIRIFLDREKYAEAVRNLNISNMKIHWKIYFLCAKYKFAVGVAALLAVINYLRRR